MTPSSAGRTPPPGRVGRYTLHSPIASGGMATVYFGKLSGPVGFSRVVAIKRMHPRLASDPQFVAMFLDEATLASRVHHPNVVPTLDVVADGRETFLVMDYVRGPSLSALLTAAARAREPVPVDVANGVLIGVLAGLHAAHEACDRKGQPLGLVHRDVSPHNVLVGVDGVPRIMDFGVAKAARSLHVTQEGQLKGKLSYMAPEQVRGTALDRRADVFAAGVVLWTVLAGRRLFRGDDIADTMTLVLNGEIPPLTSVRPDVPPGVEAAVARSLERDRALRYPTAREFASALEAGGPVASARTIGEWVQRLASDVLAEREAVVAEIEDTEDGGADPVPADTAVASMDAGGEATVAQGAPRKPAPAGPEASWSSAPTLEMRPSAPPGEPSADEGATQTELALPKEPPPIPTSRRGTLVLAAVAVAAVAGAVVVARVVAAPAAAPTDPAPLSSRADPAPAAAPAPAAPSASGVPSPATSASPATSTSEAPSAHPRPMTPPREQPRVVKPRPAAPARATAQPAAPGDPGYLPPRP